MDDSSMSSYRRVGRSCHDGCNIPIVAQFALPLVFHANIGVSLVYVISADASLRHFSYLLLLSLDSQTGEPVDSIAP